MTNKNAAWIETWLESVAVGKAAMSQRKMSSIDSHGGLAPVVHAARAKGLHLLQLTDDKGVTLVAATRLPVKTLC